jgi:restriction system protein
MRRALPSLTLRVTFSSVPVYSSSAGCVMARGSSSSGSYREWEAARRAEQRAKEQAARLQEQQRKARERERTLQEATARDEQAATDTLAVEERVAELEGLLRSSLARDPRISMASLRRHIAEPPLDLGQLAFPLPAPQWTDFEPEPMRVSAGYSAASNDTKLPSR